MLYLLKIHFEDATAYVFTCFLLSVVHQCLSYWACACAFCICFESKSCSVMSDSLQYQGLLQARILEWVAFPFSRASSQPGIEPRSPALQADSLCAEPQGKPKNTGVGSLSLLQQIFLTQELNQGLLHCRRILYQLSYQESPLFWKATLMYHIEPYQDMWDSFLPLSSLNTCF